MPQKTERKHCCHVNVTIGLMRDHPIKTEKIVLYKYGDVFFPKNDYYNSEPLPIEWLELFERKENIYSLYEEEYGQQKLDELFASTTECPPLERNDNSTVKSKFMDHYKSKSLEKTEFERSKLSMKDYFSMRQKVERSIAESTRGCSAEDRGRRGMYFDTSEAPFASALSTT